MSDNIQTSEGLAALFLEHAKGMVTENALRERRKRILKFIQEKKYLLTSKNLEPLLEEIEEINHALGVE